MTLYTLHNYKSLAWSITNGPGSGRGTSQSFGFFWSSRQQISGRSLIASFQERLGLHTCILRPAFNSFRVNAAPSHLKELYLNKQKHKLKTEPDKTQQASICGVYQNFSSLQLSFECAFGFMSAFSEPHSWHMDWEGAGLSGAHTCLMGPSQVLQVQKYIGPHPSSYE